VLSVNEEAFKIGTRKAVGKNEKWSTVSLHLDNRKYLFRPTYVLLVNAHLSHA